MCDDLKGEMALLREKGVDCTEVVEARWGLITKLQLPGGGEVGLYEPSTRGLRIRRARPNLPARRDSLHEQGQRFAEAGSADCRAFEVAQAHNHQIVRGNH